MMDERSAFGTSLPHLGRVFNYELGMMKENVEPRTIDYKSLLDSPVVLEQSNPMEISYPLCGNLYNQPFRTLKKRKPMVPLLSNVFNYDLGMMKEKNLDGTQDRCAKSLSGYSMKENVSPHPKLPQFEGSSNRAALHNSGTKRSMSTMSTPKTKSSKERIPLSNMSNSHGNVGRVDGTLQTKNKRNKLTPVSILSAVFESSDGMESTPLKEHQFSKRFGDIAQNLDFEMVECNENSLGNFEHLEYSTIRDTQVPDDDCYSDDENEENVDWPSHENPRPPHQVPSVYASLGAPNVKCPKCEAWMWKEERVNKYCTKSIPEFSICCAKGEIQLPKEKPTPSYLWQLFNDKKKGQQFKDSIRVYNSMFAFTSTGGRVDHSVNCGGAPYVYRLNGQNHHLFGSLIPDEGEPPKFCQLYIYDTVNETNNRLKWINVHDGKQIEAEIVDGLTKMLDETNELMHEFRMQRDRFDQEKVTDLEITLKISRADNGRENHIVPSDDLAGIMVGDLDENSSTRDIIIHSHEEGLQRISDIHPKLMALQYPLLFPHGDDGFHIQLEYMHTGKKKKKKRELISMKEYYSYKFQVRHNEGMTPRLGGRLYQQYVVDAFSTIEQARLWWFRKHQTTLRNELYRQIYDSVRKGEVDASNVGKGIILPAGFVGSRRYMQQNFQDALAVCRYIGHPDIFLTMTTNPLWDEILQMMELTPHCLPQNSPDIISRVFKLKLDQLLDDIRKKSVFGKCIAVMYVVEFQKRGLPHVHMLIWLDAASKKNLTKDVDKFVSAEIPDPNKDKAGYDAVKAFMIHGPCGAQNPKSPCMKDFQCIRHFPKKYCPSTTFDESGFPQYRRRKTDITVNVRKEDLDNKWVVPYNRDLLVKYQCHMNVEICCHARSIKYLFKYCLKGHDRATVEIKGFKKKGEKTDDNGAVDEINEYFDGRYICAAEAAYRIFGYNIHYRSTSVQRLSFHLPGNKSCTFKSNEKLEKVLNREKMRYSQLEAFFHLNRNHPTARQYTYDEIPQHYVWNESDNIWNTRKRGKQIGRLFYTHHSTGELWYLRLLLTKVRGPTSFESLRTVNGKIFPNFHEACKEYGLLDDDNE